MFTKALLVFLICIPIVLVSCEAPTTYIDNYHFNLRDIGPAGGYIFYINLNANADGWKYLEAAPADQSASLTWIEGGTTQSSFGGITTTAPGHGLSNSNAIIAQSGHTSSAAELCLNYSILSYQDWFLPTEEELTAMDDNLDDQGVGGFSADSYWSSSENNALGAYSVNFGTNFVSVSSKSGTHRVRAVRSF